MLLFIQLLMDTISLQMKWCFELLRIEFEYLKSHILMCSCPWEVSFWKLWGRKHQVWAANPFGEFKHDADNPFNSMDVLPKCDSIELAGFLGINSKLKRR